MDSVIVTNPKILGGTPCFVGTRVPVKSLFDHLEGGYTIDYFLTQFPSVRREQVMAVLEQSRLNAEQVALVASSR
jgi:uncharacterized protein (DUF433 family)